MTAVHYRRAARTGSAYLCGIGKRWPSQTITSTGVRDAVTCLSCLRALAATDPEATP
jgi:hypothetical protein